MKSLLFLTSYFLLPLACVGSRIKNHAYDIKVATTSTIQTLDERYLSYCMEPNLIQKKWETFDFSSKRLSFLAKGLAPAYLRFGGTSANRLFFDEPPPKKYVYQPKKGYMGKIQEDISNFTMTKNDWDNLNGFAQAAGFRLLFDLNALIRNGTSWDPTNTRKLLSYALDKSYTSNIDFELGNEPTYYPGNFNRSITSEQCGNDYIKLKQVLEEDPFKKVFNKAKIVGPAVVGSIEHTTKFLTGYLETVKSNIDAMTWHQYYMNEKEATIDKFTDPKVFDSLANEIEGFQNIRDKAGMKNLTIWLGETGSAYGGGAPGFSDTYVAGFLFLDKLGLAAKHGISVVVRESFYGAHYNIIDYDLYPLPDYWLSLLYKRLVGRRVLNASLSVSDNSVRVYAHCTQQRGQMNTTGSVTVYAINVLSEAAVLRFSDELTISTIEEYLLTPIGKDSLKSKFVALNGKKLALIDDTTFPELTPVVYKPGVDVILPSKSFAFYVFPNPKAGACL